jgi:predicted GH43/DUF377 family glycosyl hydrolase
MTSLFLKSPHNPVIGPESADTFFDCCVVPVGEGLRMYLSWRDRHSLAVCESPDGVTWSAPRIVLAPEPAHPWERDAVNRPHVLHTPEGWWLWYTGQNFAAETSALGLARGEDGLHWERVQENPVLSPAGGLVPRSLGEGGWEKQALMCPHVLYESGGPVRRSFSEGGFRMWYSGGEMFEPDAVGYAESADGIHWQRAADNPVLRPTGDTWEASRVTAACIVPRERDYLAFYLGFGEGFERSQIGLARSRDGVRDWERYPGNPVIGPGPEGAWDDCNVYKPYALRWRERWYLWYNASRASDRREQLGLAVAEEIEF